MVQDAPRPASTSRGQFQQTTNRSTPDLYLSETSQQQQKQSNLQPASAVGSPIEPNSPPPSAQPQQSHTYGHEDAATLRARKRRRIITNHDRSQHHEFNENSTRVNPTSTANLNASSTLTSISTPSSTQPLPLPTRTTFTKATLPTPRVRPFDGYNSTSTGHQVADGNRLAGSTSWRLSRTYKLGYQFRGTGGRRADLVGAGAGDGTQDSREQEALLEERNARALGGDIRGFFAGTGKSGTSSGEENGKVQEMQREEKEKRKGLWGVDGLKQVEEQARRRHTNKHIVTAISAAPRPPENNIAMASGSSMTTATAAEPQIFQGLTIFVNGSTMPLISDHKLKQVLATHGANMALGLARRTVTHVIVGKAAGDAVNPGERSGVGGGLAAGKIQKEVMTMRGKGVKFVGVEWVLKSIEAGKRLPEARFAVVHIAAKGQGSVYKTFGGNVDSQSPKQ